MANIAISDIETVADTLENEDLVLVSKYNTDGTFKSAKMTGEKLKNATGTTCQASSALTSYGTAKTSDVTSAKTAITTAISSLNNLSSSQVQSACSTAISSSGIKGIFIDPSKTDGFSNGRSLTDYTLLYDSAISLVCPLSVNTDISQTHSTVSGSISLSIKVGGSYKEICELKTQSSTQGPGSSTYITNASNSTPSTTCYVKKGSVIKIAISGDGTSGGYSICPVN